MAAYREISPVMGAVDGVVTPPGSKSITNRALLCAAMAEGLSQLEGVLDSDDTHVMIESLRRLGVDVIRDGNMTKVFRSECVVATDDDVCELFVGNSGTTVRFLTAMLATGATGRRRFRLDGVARMRERPIGDLIRALQSLGAAIRSESENGCPPLLLNAAELRGGTVSVHGDVSSQFLSGLLMAAPYTTGGGALTIEVEPDATGQRMLVSTPYVTMTLAVMRAFGAKIDTDAALTRFTVSNATKDRYHGRAYRIEPDASAASYFLATAAITGGRVTIPGLSADSLQGDVRFADVLAGMGCRVRHDADRIELRGPADGVLRGTTVEMCSISDTAQTLAVVALFADSPTRITGVGNMRFKETDRIAATATELRRLGATVAEYDDGLLIEPLSPDQWERAEPIVIETYDDHRMAMSFAQAGLRIPGVRIADPGCTAKTYPGFFDDFERLCRSADE